MIGDALTMIRDLNAGPRAVARWGAALNLPQLIGGPVFFWRWEGPAVFAACAAAVLIAGQIHKRRPFSRLTSVSHVFWLPLLPALAWSLQRADGVFSIWLGYVAATIAVSLALDAWNLVLYARGDRAFYSGSSS